MQVWRGHAARAPRARLEEPLPGRPPLPPMPPPEEAPEPTPGFKELGQLQRTFHSLQLPGLADRSHFLARGMFGEVWVRPDGLVAKRPRGDSFMGFGACFQQVLGDFARSMQLPTHPLFVAPVGWAADPVGFATVWPFVDGVPVGRVASTAASRTVRHWQVSAINAISHAISNEFILWDLHFDDIVVVGGELRFLDWSMAPSNDTGSLQALPPAYRHGGAQRATLLSSKSAAMITLDVDFFVAAVIALFFDLLRLGKKDVAIRLTVPGGPMPESVAQEVGGIGSMIYKAALADDPGEYGVTWDYFQDWVLSERRMFPED